MSLRDQFNQERDTRVSRQLESLARSFERQLRKRVKKKPQQTRVDFDIDELKNSEYKTAPGYKKLHEAAQAADVKIEAEIYSSVIRVTINQPYASSPDKYLFFPASPPAPAKPAAPEATLRARLEEKAPTVLDVVREQSKNAPRPNKGPGAAP